MAHLDYSPWVPVQELRDAVAEGFLTKKEARLVLWARLPELQQQAIDDARKPPAIQ